MGDGRVREQFPSSSFNLDLFVGPLIEVTRKAFLAHLSCEGWVRDEAGWWTFEG